MAKKLYWGDSSSKARKGKKMYWGDTNGKARKVKKAYFGDSNGKARLWWSGGGDLKYNGRATALTTGVAYAAAATAGSYAIFAGGAKGDLTSATNCVTNVDTYNTSLTKGTATALSIGKCRMAGVSIGGYALFAGGHRNTTEYKVVRSYDSALTVNDSVTSLTSNTFYSGTTTVGGYALIGGGATTFSSNSISGFVNTVYSYNSSLTMSKPGTPLTNAGYFHGVTTVGGYALFGGGYGSSSYQDVDTYNTSLTKGTAPSLISKGYKCATTVGDHAIFVGSNINASTDAAKSVVAYTTTLTQVTLPNTSASINPIRMAATSVGEFAIFAPCNLSTNNANGQNVLVYDSSLTQVAAADFEAIYGTRPTAITLGNYAIFAGGWSSSQSGYNYVETFKVD